MAQLTKIGRKSPFVCLKMSWKNAYYFPIFYDLIFLFCYLKVGRNAVRSVYMFTAGGRHCTTFSTSPHYRCSTTSCAVVWMRSHWTSVMWRWWQVRGVNWRHHCKEIWESTKMWQVVMLPVRPLLYHASLIIIIITMVLSSSLLLMSSSSSYLLATMAVCLKRDNSH